MSGSCIRRRGNHASKNGITTPIHVLGGAVERQIPLFIEHDLTFTAPSVDKLKQINEAAEAAKTIEVHLKIDKAWNGSEFTTTTQTRCSKSLSNALRLK